MYRLYISVHLLLYSNQKKKNKQFINSKSDLKFYDQTQKNVCLVPFNFGHKGYKLKLKYCMTRLVYIQHKTLLKLYLKKEKKENDEYL